MSEDKPRFGIIGLGKRGMQHATTLLKLSREYGCTLAAACESNGMFFDNLHETLRADGLLEPSQTIPTFAGHRQMLKSADLDAVIVASPAAYHERHASESLAAGCNVYVESPLSWDPGLPDSENRKRGLTLINCARSTEKMICGGPSITAWFEPKGPYTPVIGDFDGRELEAFKFEMASGTGGSLEDTLLQLAPRGLAVLRKVAGPGRVHFADMGVRTGTTTIHYLPFRQTAEQRLHVSFTYERERMPSVGVRMHLETTPGQHRLDVNLNGQLISQQMDAEPLSVLLDAHDEQHFVPNPVEASLCSFLDAMRYQTNPRKYAPVAPVGNALLLRDTHNMLCDVMEEYSRFSAARHAD